MYCCGPLSVFVCFCNTKKDIYIYIDLNLISYILIVKNNLSQLNLGVASKIFYIICGFGTLVLVDKQLLLDNFASLSILKSMYNRIWM